MRKLHVKNIIRQEFEKIIYEQTRLIESRRLASRDAINEASKERMIAQIERAEKEGTSIYKLPKATQDFYNKVYKKTANESINLRAAHLSSEDYQKAKKLKAFNSTDWIWNSKSHLYDKVNESMVTEANDAINQIFKDSNGDLNGFVKLMDRLGKKLGKKRYRALIVQSLTKLGINGDHYDYRDNDEAVQKLHGLISVKTESVVSEAKFFRLPTKLNIMWDLKNSVNAMVSKHDNGDDYNPAEMKTIEELIKKIKKSVKAFKSIGDVKGTLYEASLSKVYNASKKGSYPITLVAIEGGKVVDQKLVGTPEIVPAAFNDMQSEFPKAQINVEDRTGKILFKESRYVAMGGAFAKEDYTAFQVAKALSKIGINFKNYKQEKWMEAIIEYFKENGKSIAFIKTMMNDDDFLMDTVEYMKELS